ncbi:hypothetical protein B0T14DRAFT_608214 [Immersiella caudata]|uniref:Uncharacterized protein n=1 Tax=Immersiella caudata TaxID=314043 RepID=A0AA39U1Y8_9PEZI|nr:hypothetical protein B0T14DRAFT_608214 [Immersiella caudata]
MSSAAEQPSTHRRLFLVSVPRTGSNLLVRVLNVHDQPNILTNEKASYFFQNAYFLGTSTGYLYKPLAQWTDAEKPTNQTLFHDSYLAMWHFNLVIRHSALAWPSMYRAALCLGKLRMLTHEGMLATAKSNTTFQRNRSLPEVILRFCEMTGLDRDRVQFKWGGEEGGRFPRGEKRGEEAGISGRGVVFKAARMMPETWRVARGIITEKAPREVDIEAEVGKWKREFGEEVAALLERVVGETMEDYLYLRERRLSVE